VRRVNTVAAVFFAVLLLPVLTSCGSKDEKILKDLEMTESASASENGELSRKRIAELKKGIEEYKKEVDRTVKATVEIGIYYRMVALEFMKLKMYGKAYEYFDKAIDYYPENEVLFYYAGVCIARMGKAEMDSGEARRMYQKAAVYYKRAVELRNRYTDALYALSVLYLFELDKPEEAIPLLERILKYNSKNTDAMFLLAKARIMRGEYRKAVDVYNEIIKVSKDEDAVTRARNFRDTIMSEVTGG